jgi:phospholipid/cholesterol/gamma-HCH transport system permease protein
VLRFFGESLRQAGILILGSALIIWGLVFVLGLQCGIEGAYLLRAQGAPAYAGVFSAWCDLREVMPYAFGYMLAAEGRDRDRRRARRDADLRRDRRARGDGRAAVTFLCATRLLAAWIAFPFMYLCGIGIMYFASYLAVVQQIGDVSSGGYD